MKKKNIFEKLGSVAKINGLLDETMNNTKKAGRLKKELKDLIQTTALEYGGKYASDC